MTSSGPNGEQHGRALPTLEPDGRSLPTREQYRQQLLAGLGGWSGTVITAIPTVVFVLVNATTGLRPAIFAAIGAAAVLVAYRLARRQPVQQAVSGLAGVAIAAMIAARTGEAKGYFLFGIVTSFVWGAGFLVTIGIRRPAVGLLWEFLDPTPGPTGVRWWHRAPLLRAYVVATLAGAAVFLSRGVVQVTLFRHNATGWLAVARIAMGYPLTIAAIGVAFWAVRRARRQLARLPVGASNEPSGTLA
ncbi:MAG: DUF3159 domain-containing protein [Actinomycetota bacterium]